MLPTDVPAVARAQAGTFTRAQAYAHGWTFRQVRRRLASGRWRVVAGEALVSTADPVGYRQLAFAVVLTWPNAVVSHELAGAWHGIFLDPVTTGTATVDVATHRQVPGLQTHRLPLSSGDVCRVGRIPLTTPRRTAIDLLRTQSWRQCRTLWALLSARRLLAVSDIAAEAARTPGRHGTPQLRRLVQISASGSLSAAEDLVHDILRCALITGWRANAPIVVAGRVIAIADVLFEAARLVVEVDGYGAHSSREAFQRDRTRQNELVAAGYTVLRFTWADLTGDPLAVVAVVRAALAR